MPGNNIVPAVDSFQFTPLREGRRYFDSVPHKETKFQFTPLREGRPCRFACCFLAFCISIHAPPRGATRHIRRQTRHIHISIHAPPRGATNGVLFMPM